MHRLIPFTIRLVDRTAEESSFQPVRLKLDPGSKVTGMALVRGERGGAQHVLWLAELHHRGQAIRDALTQRRAFRRRRRTANLRYRPARFNNRRRPNGWLAPSLRHRVETTGTWVCRLSRWAPISGVSQELVRFDTQALQNPKVSGVEYQRGTLFGYEVREYLLEKWNRTCAYCGAQNVPLEIDHVIPKSIGGSDRVSNLVLSCRPCNQAKGNRPVEEFLRRNPERLKSFLAQLKAPLRDAAAVNSTRWALLWELRVLNVPVEVATAGRTKWNRTRLGIPKTHALDAVCVGEVESVTGWAVPVLYIHAMGRGSYQRVRLDKFGFPRGYLIRTKNVKGFRTGDLVLADVSNGKNAGTYIGRVAVRASGSFNIQTINKTVQGVSYRYCRLLQRADGYRYHVEPFRGTAKEEPREH